MTPASSSSGPDGTPALRADRDFGNRSLAHVAGGSVGLAIALIALTFALPDSVARPGSPLLQSAGIVGSLALLGAVWAALAKRRGRSARRGFARHAWLSGLGFALVAFHGAGEFDQAPALLLAVLVALMVLGLWARIPGARKMAATFGSKGGALSPSSQSTRSRLAEIIKIKQALVGTFDPSAVEATFSLQPRHWRRHPFSAFAYHKLVREERQIMGTDQSVPTAQAYWRRVHQVLAIAFVVGLAIHVILGVFFAGYVAEGREVYWWHISAWDF